MNLLVVESTADPASLGIAAALRKLEEWQPTGDAVSGEAVLGLASSPGVHLVRTPLLHLRAEPLEAAARAAGIPFEAIVFLSKHKAASGRPALTVHPVGNPGAAEFGGLPGRFSPCAPGLQSSLLRALAARARQHAYAGDVTFEVTHHGPLLSTPACFLELGSTERDWGDPFGARLVAAALLDVVRDGVPDHPVAVGLGGGHYGPRFTEAAITRAVHFGHMIPSYAADKIGDPTAVLEEAVRATPGAAGVYAHRKMLERSTLDRWAAASKATGVAWLESDAWPVLLPPPSA